MHKKSFFRAGAAILLASQVACVSIPYPIPYLTPELTGVTPEMSERFAGISLEQAVADAEAKVAKAYENELNFYSPRNLGTAEDALTYVRKQMQEKPQRDTFLVRILLIESSIGKGYAVKSAVKNQLAEVFSMRAALEEAKAPMYDKGRYDDVVGEIKDLIDYIERDRAERARGEIPALVAKMKTFETEAIKHHALNPAKLILSKASSQNAEEYAPRTLQEARTIYAQAEAYIMSNPHDKESVARLGSESLFAARHALYVAEAARDIQNMGTRASEDIVLDAERRLKRIAEALNHPDVRDRSLHDQTMALAGAAGQLVVGRDELREKIDTLQARDNSAELAAMREKISTAEQENGALKTEISQLKAKIGEMGASLAAAQAARIAAEEANNRQKVSAEVKEPAATTTESSASQPATEAAQPVAEATTATKVAPAEVKVYSIPVTKSPALLEEVPVVQPIPVEAIDKKETAAGVGKRATSTPEATSQTESTADSVTDNNTTVGQ
ncbi:MAG: hypothetical protein OEV28_01770 [Nitrospirota bacterium]|nr:hypothetical protein [Nitrospirota bacterium]